jgi:photosystem II stability/assembly factor-like uncharacterized protein
MAGTGTILVGTPGQGVFRSADEGESWTRGSIGQGLHSDAIIRTLALHSQDPRTVYAGSDYGLYRSDNAGESWSLLDTPMNHQVVWSVVFDPTDAQTMLAVTGTPSIPALFRSTDAGASWTLENVEIARECPAVGVPRPTGIAFDPTNSANVWMGLEVDGMRRSVDGGNTWTRTAEAIHNLDVHNVAVAAGPPKTVFVLVNNDIFASTDDGESWRSIGVRENFGPYRYPRGVCVKPDDPRVVYITLGDATPGRIGAVMRSSDTGKTWEALVLDSPPNSAMWVVHVPAQQPNTVFAGSRYGCLYRSDDGGDHFQKLWRELSEVSSIAFVAGE